jgi:hypothetical protein
MVVTEIKVGQPGSGRQNYDGPRDCLTFFHENTGRTVCTRCVLLM